MAIYKAEIDKFKIDMQTITDSFENNVAKYSYPFSDGANLDYMGENARVIDFECYFFKKNYQTHYDFLEHIRSGDVFQLTHPKYGLINGRIESPIVNHNDGIEHCVITIKFIEQKIGQEVEVLPDVVIEINEAFGSGQDGSMETAAIDIDKIVGEDSKNVLSTVLDPLKTVSSQISGVTFATRQVMAGLDVGIGYISATLSELQQPADSLVNLIDYGTKLPGTIAKPVTQLIEAYAFAQKKKNNLPSSFISSLKAVKNSFKTSLKRATNDATTFEVFENCFDLTTAQVGSVYMSRMYDTDEKQRNEHFKNININAFNSLGERVFNSKEIELYNVNELENSLFLIRQELGTTFELNRNGLTAHKVMARALKCHVDNVKLDRENIVKVSTKGKEIPVHTLCLLQGLSHRNIFRIMAINEIKNPTFAKGDILLYE